MTHRIATLLLHDLAVSFKSKSLYLVIFIPLFVYATLTMVDSNETRVAHVNLALIRTAPYPPVILDNLNRATGQFAIRWVSTEEEATCLLKTHGVDGVLIPGQKDTSRLQLTVVRQTSVETLTLVHRLSALQTAVERKTPDWIATIHPIQTSSIKQQTLPTWILMMVLLVSLIVLPAQVAEEKEKQLLLGCLQTPVRESEWLAAKTVYGILLMLVAVLTLQLLGEQPSYAQGMRCLAMLCVGGFCFGALGICLGLLCRNQASARTLGVLCYLPLLLPAALSDNSQALKTIAPWFPSHQFYEPIRAILLEGRTFGAFMHSWTILLAIGLLASLASHRLIKKRWLMS